MSRHSHHHTSSNVSQYIIGHINGHLFSVCRIDRHQSRVHSSFLFFTFQSCLLALVDRFVDVTSHLHKELFSPTNRFQHFLG